MIVIINARMILENNRMLFLHQAVIWFAAVFVLSLLGACSGDSDPEPAVEYSSLTVNQESIEINTDEGDTSRVQLHGSTYLLTSDSDCERWIFFDLGWLGSDYVCVSYYHPDMHVHWINQTTGASGSVEADYKGYSNPNLRYYWTASVPIIPGVNEIRFTSDASPEPVTVFVEAGEDRLQPSVVYRYPPDESDQVSTNATISVKFSESVDAATVTSDSFFVTMNGGDAIDGDISLSESGLYAYFKPPTLYTDTQYFVTLTTDILDISGKPLDSVYTWAFSTGEGDYEPPLVTQTIPTADATNIPAYSSISATFDETIDRSSLTQDIMIVRDIDGNRVDGAISVQTSGGLDTMTFVPDALLDGSTLYTVMLSSTISDPSGNTLENGYSWSFTTAVADVTAPVITRVVPVDADTCVPPEQSISAYFNEYMSPSSLNENSFLLSDDYGNAVSGSITNFSYYSKFKPDNKLKSGTQYQATITSEAADLSGNSLSNDYTWRFSTIATRGNWSALATENEPASRSSHSVIWTGDEMIIWGGNTNTGGIYNASTDSWSATSLDGAPERRSGHSAVWTGSEMIVWGGSGLGGRFNDGYRYDPASNTWHAISSVGAPNGRYNHTAIWTGEEMIIWGGSTGVDVERTPGIYNPSTDTWRTMSTTGMPEESAAVAWTGSELIAITYIAAPGGIYNPASDTWRSISEDSDRSIRLVSDIVWTGNTLVVWGNDYYSLGDYFSEYDPATDSWRTLSKVCSPSDVDALLATPYGVIAYRKTDVSSTSGGMFDLATDTWTAINLMNIPPDNYEKIIWTGSEMLVWGNEGGSSFTP